MRRHALCVALVFTTLVTHEGVASAAEVGAPPDAPRPARTGFQAHFFTGMALPAGKATGAAGDALAKRYAWQIPIGVDLGGKLSPSVYLGGYLIIGVGSEGSDRLVEALCDDDDHDWENDVRCSAVNVRPGPTSTQSAGPDRSSVDTAGANRTVCTTCWAQKRGVRACSAVMSPASTCS